MTPPLDLEAIKRRDAWCAERVGTGDVYRTVARPDAERNAHHLRSATGSELDAILDRRDLIAEVERLTATLEDQNERIAQLHRESSEAAAEAGRLRAEIERPLPVKHLTKAEQRKADFLAAFKSARSGLLAVNEPATWTDRLGVARRTIRTNGRLRASKFPLHEALRAFVYERDGNRCVLCGYVPQPNDCLRGPTFCLELDHIISRRNGGSHHPDNLQVLCNSCNSRKSGLIDSKHGHDSK